MKSLRIIGDLADLFYPRICPGCGFPLRQTEHTICLFCKHKLPKTRFTSFQNNPVAQLFWGRIAIHQADAWLFFRKKGMAQKLMHDLKYHGNAELGKELGVLYGRDLLNRSLAMPDIISSVPLHPDKRKRRGFNQSECIAEGIASVLKVPFDPGFLFRSSDVESQTRKKRYERWENAVGTYKAANCRSGFSGHVAIVDDVLTTGATLEACAHAVAGSGVSDISVFSLCLAIK
jgi:ComF family protein